MKKVDTNKYTKLTLSLERIRAIITELPHNGHRFVVLYDDKPDKQGYIQTILEDDTLGEQSPYLLETRVYHTEDTFSHYRKSCAKAQEIFPYFEDFYKDIPLSYENWEEVTKEFLED